MYFGNALNKAALVCRGDSMLRQERWIARRVYLWPVGVEAPVGAELGVSSLGLWPGVELALA